MRISRALVLPAVFLISLFLSNTLAAHAEEPAEPAAKTIGDILDERNVAHIKIDQLTPIDRSGERPLHIREEERIRIRESNIVYTPTAPTQEYPSEQESHIDDTPTPSIQKYPLEQESHIDDTPVTFTGNIPPFIAEVIRKHTEKKRQEEMIAANIAVVLAQETESAPEEATTKPEAPETVVQEEIEPEVPRKEVEPNVSEKEEVESEIPEEEEVTKKEDLEEEGGVVEDEEMNSEVLEEEVAQEEDPEEGEVVVEEVTCKVPEEREEAIEEPAEEEMEEEMEEELEEEIPIEEELIASDESIGEEEIPLEEDVEEAEESEDLDEEKKDPEEDSLLTDESPGLKLVEVSIDTISAANQSCVAAFFDDLSVLDNQDTVDLLDGTEPVSDDDSGAPLHQLTQCLLDQLLGE